MYKQPKLPNENNKLQPITTVYIDHVTPKTDLGIEHVVIGVGNRRRFSESEIGAGFRPRVSSAYEAGTPLINRSYSVEHMTLWRHVIYTTVRHYKLK